MKANLKLSKFFLLMQLAIVGAAPLLVPVRSAWAQTITSNPANGATGVSVSAPVVFTFSSAVDPTQTMVTFFSSSPPGSYPVTSAWSSGNTVLTCTPTPAFPGNATISWAVIDQSASPPIFASGSFSTGTGSTGGGGSGTNAITTFSVGKLYFYQQTNTSSPTLNTNLAYGFSANTSLASNRTATAITVTIPGHSSPTSLSQNFVAHEDYYFFDYNNTNQTTFEATYPQGNYVFSVTGSSNQQVTLNFPTSMQQPNAPHISNFTAAQSVNAAQAFTVTWDAFQGGTAADFIGLSVDDGAGVVFHTPYPGTNGVLPGTALSATIPAATLAAGSNYLAEVLFYRYTAVSNATYATAAYRASGTQFTITTASGASGSPPVVSNPIWAGGSLGFDVRTSPNQALKVRFSTDCSQPISQWQTLFTTNSPGTSVHIAIPVQAGAAGFVRLQNGP
jgi:hypothetical protein